MDHSEVATGGVLWEKVFLEMSQNSQKNTCARAALWKKFIKKRLWHRCFPVNFAKILRAPFLQNTWTAASCHCSQILIILRGLCPCFDHSQGDLKWDSCFHICLNSEFSWAQKLATFRLFKSLSHTVVTYHMTWIQLHCSCVESELTPRR